MRTQLPEYQCHKKVRAAKISTVNFDNEEKTDYTIRFEDAEQMPICCSAMTNRPLPAPGMYAVVYEDGYLSFSPAKAFEEGYTRL